VLPTLRDAGALGYWAVLVVSALESLAFVGLLIPGTVFMVTVGFLCSQGMFDLGDVFWFAVAGAIIGDGASFYLGRRGARWLTAGRIGERWREVLTRGEHFFRRHGNKSVFLARFVGPLRPVVPFVGGMFAMPARVFLVWNVASAFLWSASYLLAGYFFGATVALAWSSRVGLTLLAVVVVVALVCWAKRAGLFRRPR